MNIIEIAQKRYSTKEFESGRKLSPELMESLKTLLRLSPSSTNIQPWHFIIAQSDAAKSRIAKSTLGFFEFNKSKVLDASAVVIFATRVAADREYMDHLSDTEDLDGRFATAEYKAQNHAGRQAFANIHRYDLKDQQHWFEKQTYLNAGNLLLGVAALGLDAVPMEGFDAKTLGQEFGLIEQGFTASLIIAIGYHAESDFNVHIPKSRLAMEEIIEVL
ncbi:MAG: oxygen-insensitive NAD(P)H nitroreductase [Rikenellaceae bacterium]